MAKTTLKGKVISAKMQNTAVVEISRLFRHPKYKKQIRRRKKIKAHNEKNQYKEGETVIIEAMRPISKEKHFRIIGYADGLEIKN